MSVQQVSKSLMLEHRADRQFGQSCIETPFSTRGSGAFAVQDIVDLGHGHRRACVFGDIRLQPCALELQMTFPLASARTAYAPLRTP